MEKIDLPIYLQNIKKVKLNSQKSSHFFHTKYSKKYQAKINVEFFQKPISLSVNYHELPKTK